MNVKELQEKLDCVNEEADLVSIFVERDGIDKETGRYRFQFEMKFDIQEVTSIIRGEYLSFRVANPEEKELTHKPFSNLGVTI